MRRILALSLLVPALAAQTPAPPTTQTLAQKVATETKAIEALKLENPVEALEKAKALLPAAKLPFDKTNLQTAFASIREWNAQLDIYRLIYNTAIAAGRFEGAKEASEKGRDVAKELQTEAMVPFNDFKTTWLKAGEASSKLLDEIKELEAKVEADRVASAASPKSKVTIEEANAELMRQHEVSQRLAFLKANEATYRQNIEFSTKATVPLAGPIKDFEARIQKFEASVEQWDKYLKEEAESIITKYKGDKTRYAAGLLGGVAPIPVNKEDALVALHRAAFLDPKNAAIEKRIDQILGKVATPPVKPAKVKKKKGAQE